MTMVLVTLTLAFCAPFARAGTLEVLPTLHGVQDETVETCAVGTEQQAHLKGSALLQVVFQDQTRMSVASQANEDDTAAQTWEHVDGGSGRACRGASADRAFERYVLYRNVNTLSECKELCAKTPTCTGITHDPSRSRCEVWTTPIERSVALGGHTCLRFKGTPAAIKPRCTKPSVWELVGGRPGMGCRGENACDYNSSHFALHTLMPSLDDCKAQCAIAPFCTGIGYDGASGRCEVWLKSISSSAPQNNSTCLSYPSGTPAPGIPRCFGARVTQAANEPTSGAATET